jgi:hypothetical protein
MYQPTYRNFYRAVPIASEMEMGNITVEYNGMPTYFHNQSNDEIFVKYFDIKTGLTPITKYVRADKAVEEKKEDEGVNVYDEKINAINERIDGLCEMLEKGGKK